MKNNLIYGVHIFESDLANELDSIVEDAYHYGATEAEIRSLIDTFRKETVRTALEKEIFLTLRLAILWQYGWLRPEEVAPLQQLVQKGVSKKWLQQFGTDTPPDELCKATTASSTTALSPCHCQYSSACTRTLAKGNRFPFLCLMKC